MIIHPILFALGLFMVCGSSLYPVERPSDKSVQLAMMGIHYVIIGGGIWAIVASIQ